MCWTLLMMANHKKKYSTRIGFSQRQSRFFLPYEKEQVQDDGSHCTWKKLNASNQKVTQYKVTSGFIFQIFIKSQVLGLQVSISDLMTYPLTLTPYSMATIDGFFAKTNKAQGMNYLIKDADNAYALLPDPNKCPLIQHGNSSFYMKVVPPTKKTNITTNLR